MLSPVLPAHLSTVWYLPPTTPPSIHPTNTLDTGMLTSLHHIVSNCARRLPAHPATTCTALLSLSHSQPLHSPTHSYCTHSQHTAHTHDTTVTSVLRGAYPPDFTPQRAPQPVQSLAGPQAGQTQRLLLRACPHRRRLVARCSEPGSGGVGVTVRPACHPRPPSVMLRPPALGPGACGAPSSVVHMVLADCSAGKRLARACRRQAGCIVLLGGPEEWCASW